MSEQRPEQKRKLPPTVIVGIILAALCGISLYIRITLPYDQVFVDGAVWFRETDAYYYMRNIENLVHNFPHFNASDPYALYPGAGMGLSHPFFGWLVAGIILLVKGAAPSLHTMEVVAAYVPPLLGTLTLIPVYFIGKELFNRWAGVMSATLVAILPGEFMNRSLLGFVDHHVAETLFSTVSILFLIMAIKRAREREISFSHILRRDWPTISRPLVYALLAGIFLGIYLLSWRGGLMFIFIMFAYLLVQFVVDHLGHKSIDYLAIVSTPLFLIAFLMLLPLLVKAADTMSVVSLLAAIIAPVVLGIVSRIMTSRALKPVYYPLVLLGLAGIGLAVLYAMNPSLLGSMLGQFSIFAPVGVWLTVTEMQPLLFPHGSLTLEIAWLAFTTSFFISFISFAMLTYVAIKDRSGDNTLFLVWSILALIAVLGQRRFGYYYVINAALLTGYLSWKMLDIAGLGKLLAKSEEVVAVVRKSKRKKEKTRETVKPETFMQPRGVWVRMIIVGIVIFFLVFFPNIRSAKALATEQNTVMDEGWYTSLLWLKDNSPEPFGDPNFYYQIYETPFQYPESAYGVMSWWPYGYAIMQIAHRIPNSNPTQAGAAQAGEFFTAQNETSANMVVNELGSQYVMIDHAMAKPGLFSVMAEWAGKSVDEFYELYYVPTPSGGHWRYQLYPEYYNSIAVRLYNFDGKAVVPTESIVISYEERVASGGDKYKELIEHKSFSSYEDAEAYVADHTSGNYRIVGMSPFSSPVPLEELNSYKLVHESEASTRVAEQTVPSVKTFEYLGSGES